MNPNMASALAAQHEQELTRQADEQHHMARLHAPRHRVPDLRVPRYRVHWTRTSLPSVAASGRPGRSWVIVISASRGLRRA
jgi:hypothetical protein